MTTTTTITNHDATRLIAAALQALSTTKGRAAVDERGLAHARRLLEQAASTLTSAVAA